MPCFVLAQRGSRLFLSFVVLILSERAGVLVFCPQSVCHALPFSFFSFLILLPVPLFLLYLWAERGGPDRGSQSALGLGCYTLFLFYETHGFFPNEKKKCQVDAKNEHGATK